MRSISRGILTMCALSMPLAAAFVPPAEGPVPFRRDKLPVDAETMAALSRQVTLFTGSRVADEPDERRAVAQMTALALALDPGNREARELIAAMQEGGAPEPAEEEALERARNRAWQTLSWLEMPEAGTDGQALAACLGDVLAVADPKHPRARERRAAGEQGAWKSWVAETPAFEAKAVETPEVMEDPADDDGEEEKPAAATLALKEVTTTMPLWLRDPKTEVTSLVAAPVNAAASLSEEGGVIFTVAGEETGKRFAQPFRRVEAALEARHGTLPKGLRVTVSTGGTREYSLSRNGLALSGATTLLVEGALTGKVPTATALAVVGEGGKLELPAGFWKTLRGMSALPAGMRIVLPDEAADFLTALVVLDDAAFFMKHEVLLAGSVDELCDLAAGTPDAEVADGLTRFAEIRKVGEGKALGSFVAHPATQQRLRELTGVMPEHASARMLALQGSGSRPRFLQRKVLAQEIRTALEPAGILTTTPPQQLRSGALETAHESSRAGLDTLTGYIDIRDRDLHKAAVGVADSLRTLSRLAPKRDDEDTSAAAAKQAAEYKAARQSYAKVMRDLTMAAGDLDDFPLPKAAAEE
jgi:hypothetical protein